ncbi:predicted protein [Lichtheimia corymbifera JMRC:FSU:9682]|uniref:Uncharacterized protein n=1 Tax=Lichtheimia corymbifera JMRC:FSU:9682 TaxID=1263082 RepID=A0A068RHS3_9FUNG|nr:predicted protein [Lichtheimia corymbifera JMRC:FSU:9682]
MDNSTTHDHNANAPDAVHEDKNTVDKGDDHPTDGSFDEEEEDRGTLDQPSSSSTTATTAATEDNKAVDDDDFGDFGDNNDEFGDFDDFQSTEDFDDFQSMDDGFGPIEQQEDNDADMNAPPQPATPPKPTEAEESEYWIQHNIQQRSQPIWIISLSTFGPLMTMKTTSNNNKET